MKRSPFLLLLVCAQVVMSVAAAVLCFLQIQSARSLARQNAEIARVTRNGQAIQQMVGEAVEYGKRNRAIEPLLASVGVQLPKPEPAPKVETPAAPKSAASTPKPTTPTQAPKKKN